MVVQYYRLTERRQAILERWHEGKTYAEMGKEFGISKERISQILQRLEAFKAKIKLKPLSKETLALEDALYEKVKRLLRDKDYINVTLLQGRMPISTIRATRLIARLEAEREREHQGNGKL